MEISEIINWIETHEQTVGILKGVGLILLAWISGVFGYFKQITRKPKVRISEIISRCLICEPKENDGKSNAVCAAFLLEIEVINPTNEPIVVRSFDMQFRAARTVKLLRGWTPPLSSVSLPNRVQQQLHTGIKIMRNWFAIFPDGLELTVRGKVEPKHAESGYSLFISTTWGSWNPRVRHGVIDVLVQAHIATGEKLSVRSKIPVTYDKEFFESLVPGILEHMQDSRTWNVPNRF